MEEPEATPPPVPVMEGLSSLKETAIQINEIYKELIDSGFTENQALFMVSQLLVNTVYVGPTYKYGAVFDDDDVDMDEDDADGDFI
jgi:hypothetical protein